MPKRSITVLAVILALSISTGLLYQRFSVLSLSSVSRMQEKEVSERLFNRKRVSRLEKWGEPDGVLSGFYGDIWIVDEERQLVVYYDGDTDTVTDAKFSTRLKAPDDFSFSLTWGVYGISSYDSLTGTLIKENDAKDVSVYTAEYRPEREILYVIYNQLKNLDLDAYPDLYDPNPDIKQEPPVTYILTVTMNGSTKTIKAEHIADTEGKGELGEAFMRVCHNISSLLMSTEEWQALPAYEHIFA